MRPQQFYEVFIATTPFSLFMVNVHDQYVCMLCTFNCIVLMLQGEGVQLYIEIWDADPPHAKPDELVDILLIEHNESVGEESTVRVHSGIYEFVSMKLIITVTCIENFQGSDCSQCVPGFTGPDCQTNIDDCLGVNCSGNGQCVDGAVVAST